jgi:C4-dicarboxylate transporter DctM subunit
MMRAGYAPSFDVGTIAIAGTLAILVPPSVAFVLFGVMTETSVGKLFMAGIIPGILTAGGYIMTIWLTLKLKPELGPDPTQEEQAASTESKGRVWPMVLLIVVIMFGLYGGVATPTEISALGALGALLISLGMGRMSWPDFTHAVGGTLRISTMIMTIIFGAHLLGYFISFSQFTNALLAWIADAGLSPTVVMLAVVFVYLILGTFMDQGAIIILTAPITTALMVGLGYNPIWWGVIMIKTAEIGLVSPPLGLVTFVVSATTKTNLRSNFVGVLPFVGTELVVLALLIAFPDLCLMFTG